MKVVHINTDASKGGAAIAARRHCEAMIAAGIDAKFVSLYGKEDNHTVIFPWKDKNSVLTKIKKYICHKLSRLVVKRVAWHWIQKDFNVMSIKEIREADIIYLHWTNEFIELKSIRNILNLGKPVVWYMHDMWPFTGGCHYSFDCNEYERNCFKCPQLKILRFLASRQLKKKKEQWQGFSNLILSAPSIWLTDCIKSSSLFCDNESYTIRNVIDTDVFKPVDKKEVRKLLNLPLDKKLILFSAMGTHNPYKGTKYLVDTLSRIDNPNYEYVVVGNCNVDLFPDHVRPKIHRMGFVNSQEQMVSIYNTADILLITSMAENFPNVVIEAMACEVPVVGFSTGGIKDQIQHKENGWVVKPRDVDGLLEGINWILNEADYSSLSYHARAYVETYCSYHNVLENHKCILEYGKNKK